MLGLNELEYKYGKEKIDTVKHREFFKAHRRGDALTAVRKYYDSTIYNTESRVPTFDLYVLTVLGELKYREPLTEELLLNLCNRHLRVWLHKEDLPLKEEFTEKEIQSLCIIKKLMKK